MRNNNSSLINDESTIKLIRQNAFGDGRMFWPTPSHMVFHAMEPIDYLSMGQNDSKSLASASLSERRKHDYTAVPVGCYRLTYEAVGDRTTIWLIGVPGFDRVPIVTDTIRPRINCDGSYVQVSEHTLAHLRLFVSSHGDAYLRITRADKTANQIRKYNNINNLN